MNLRDSKEPQKAGEVTSREQLRIFTSPKGNLSWFYNYFQSLEQNTNDNKKFIKDLSGYEFSAVFIDECSDLNETIIKGIIK